MVLPRDHFDVILRRGTRRGISRSFTEILSTAADKVLQNDIDSPLHLLGKSLNVYFRSRSGANCWAELCLSPIEGRGEPAVT